MGRTFKGQHCCSTCRSLAVSWPEGKGSTLLWVLPAHLMGFFLGTLRGQMAYQEVTFLWA